MQSLKDLTLTSQALDQLHALFPMAKIEEVLDMVRNSARVTHPEGNRRYKHYVFKVDNGRVSNVSKYHVGITEQKGKCTVCGDTRKLVVWDDCDCKDTNSQGGCSLCEDGLIRRELVCPECGKR